MTQLTDADTYTYPYTIPAEECIVERNDNSACDGLTGAEIENERIEGVTHHNECNINERSVNKTVLMERNKCQMFIYNDGIN